MQTLYRHLVWSLFWLSEGKYPDRDPNGVVYTKGPNFHRALTDLAGGWSGTLWSPRFDLDFDTQYYKLANPTGGQPYGWCGATHGGPLVWTDCSSPSCGWTTAIWTNASHAENFGAARHRLFRVLPGFGVGNSIPDILHSKWLGSDQYQLGGVLCLLTHHHMAGTIPENLDKVFTRIKEDYEKEKVPARHRYPVLRVSQYKTGKVGHLPKLKGSGMQCKWLSAVLPTVFSEFMDKDNKKGQRKKYKRSLF